MLGQSAPMIKAGRLHVPFGTGKSLNFDRELTACQTQGCHSELSPAPTLMYNARLTVVTLRLSSFVSRTTCQNAGCGNW
jgi:hypothetical protein